MLCFFPSEIFESNDFYELPQNIQLLYFHLAASADENGCCVPHDILKKLYLPYTYLLPLIEDGYILPLTVEGPLSDRTYFIVSFQKGVAKEKSERRKCLYINGILINRCTNFYDEKRGLKALFSALDMGVDLDRVTDLSKRIDTWSEFVNLMDDYGICV